MVVIGMGARVLNNSRICAGSIIAAGSVVAEGNPRRFTAHSLGRVSAKMRRDITDKDYELIREYAKNYLDYVEIYLKEPQG